ncbi:MAG: sigma-54-dependent Fis family transcriptional regulator [Candidatus Rokubacteria bacterium]|nr:sigma-54-dependent Fis family transcriptional regulator [Candidatus Rokubacteria bacterium]
MPPLVLVVEDETILGDSIAIYLDRYDCSTLVARSGEEGVRLAEEASPDVAVVDVRLPGIDGLEVLRRIREASAATEVIMMTAHASVTAAVQAMKLGAFDYLTKPLDLDELRVVVDKAVAHLRMQRELSYLKARQGADGHVSGIVGESAPIRLLRKQIERIASLETPAGGAAPTVLVVGETGVGKEMVARAIHYQSPRAQGPFVEINCAAIPATLLEAELFGYERGAYTDARSAKAGLFESADGGTLFLDEIGHMDPAIQVKLLKAIEDKAVRRLGGLRQKSFNARIVAATNRDLEEAIAEGAFRADLYYRIKVLTVEVPPLRERGADIPLLARHFMRRFTAQYGLPVRDLAPDAETALLAYGWPGNVRELAHVLERAALLHGGPIVTAEQLGLAEAKRPAPVSVGAGKGVTVDFGSGGIVLDDVERELIVRALDTSGWNRTRASRLLGISKETLRYRMEKFHLSPPG